MKSTAVFSAQEPLFYYLNNGPMVIRSRDRFWGSKEATAAVWARMEAYGHWGHRNHSDCRTGQWAVSRWRLINGLGIGRAPARLAARREEK